MHAALPLPRPTGAVCHPQAYFNSAALAFIMVLPWYSPMLFLFFMGHQLGTMHPTLGHQSALASSGQSVLRAMRGRGGDHHSMRRLLASGLPWLPCYDRRDALVVKKVLDGLKFPSDGIQRTGSWIQRTGSWTTHAPEAARSSDEEYLALGFSAYVAALVANSGGDKVEGRTPRQWLHKVMVMEDTGQQLAWLDCHSPASAWRFSPSSAGAPPNSLPLGVLRQHHWFYNDGASACLFTPVGEFFVPKPDGPLWDASQLRKAPKLPTRLTVGIMIVFWLGCFSAGAQFYLQLIVGAATGAEMGAVFCSCVHFYCICGILAFFGFYVCQLLPAILTSRQGYVPHLPDFARRAHPHGYNVLGLVVNTFFWNFASSVDVTILLFAMDAIEQWPHDGAFPLHLSQVPVERQQHFYLAMGLACVRNAIAHLLVASQAYHMLFCKGGQGAKGGYLG